MPSWFDEYTESNNIDTVYTKIDRILGELSKYSRGEIDIDFIGRKVNLARSDINALYMMKRVTGKMNVASSRLLAVGFAELYRDIRRFVRVEEVRLMYEMIVGSTEEYSYLVDVSVLFDEEPTVRKTLRFHEYLYNIVNWVSDAIGINISSFIKLCMRAGMIKEKLVTDSMGNRYNEEIKRFIGRLKMRYDTYVGLLAYSIVKSKSLVDDDLINKATEVIGIKGGGVDKQIGIKGIDSSLYSSIKSIAKKRKCKIADLINEAMWMYVSLCNLQNGIEGDDDNDGGFN